MNIQEFKEKIKKGKFVVFVYPKMGKSGKFIPKELENEEGMTGCSLQTQGYNKLQNSLKDNGFDIIALSSQSKLEQDKFKNEINANYDFVSDEKFELKDDFKLKTFDTTDGMRFYFRQTLIIIDGKIIKCFDVKNPELDSSNTLDFIKSLK